MFEPILVAISMLAPPMASPAAPSLPFEHSSQRNLRESPEAAWRRRPMATLRMSIELPFEPDAAKLDVNEQARKQIRGMESAKIVTPEGIVVRIAYVEYVDASKIDLRGAAEGAMNSVRKTSGVTELKPKSRELKVSGVPAILTEATYQYRGSPVSYVVLVAGEGSRLWQVTTMFKTALSEQEAIARRIIDSVRLDR